MFKKHSIKQIVWTLITIVVLALSLFSANVKYSAAAELLLTSDQNFQYQVFGDQAYITGYVGTANEIVVPAKIDGHTVHSLSNAFNDNSQIEKVILSEGIETLEYCFRNCANLMRVEFPSTICHIDVHSEPDSDVIFAGCPRLNTIIFPKCTNKKAEGQFSFSSGAIYYEYGTDKTGAYRQKRLERYLESNEIESYELPNDITGIGMGCFAGCSSLKNIKIPTSVTSIGAYAFDGVSSVTSIDIPLSVTYLAEGALAGLKGVKNFTVLDTVTKMEYGARLFPATAKVICYKYSAAWKMAKKFENPIQLLSVAQPEIQNIKKNAQGIKLKCRVPSDANGIIVYRAAGKRNFKKISLIKGNGIVLYSDKDVKRAQKYSYCIKSFRLEKNGKALSKQSKIKKVLFSR